MNPSENASVTAPHRILPEPMFLRALYLERKRSERSGRAFVLMLLDPEAAVANDNGDNLLVRVVPTVVASVRETDIAGWHKQNSTFGILFVELGGTDTHSVVRAVRAKIMSALQAILPSGEVNRVQLTFYCYPDDWKKEDGTVSPIAALYPDLVQRETARKGARAVKRAIDILGSALALTLLSPVVLAIAVAIKLFSPGPILFRQTRIGQYSVPFTCLKFRSMHVVNDPQVHREYIKRFIAGSIDAAASDGRRVVYKITDDPRLTRVGRLLRKTSLDELPQFLNVLGGHMSLVGPRPPIPYELEAYDLWHRRRLLEVKPGITGLWQVSGRSRLPFDEMVRLDLRYATTWSLWLDLKILLQTPRAVFSGEGAY